MKNNTVVSACNQAYVWGVWLLISSMRKQGMDEPVIIGAYNWSKEWIDDIEKFPGVTVIELPISDKRSVTCSKPVVMLRAETDFVTWVDCDGFFSGNSSNVICAGEDEFYIRQRTVAEVINLYKRERAPGDDPTKVPPRILQIWQRDVGGLTTPRYDRGVSAALISTHRKHFDLLQHWIDQMYKVLPADVSIVDDNSIAYFQTDESVINSLLLFAREAPPMTANYCADKPDKPHFVHFGYNPKPWILWNRNSFHHFDATMDIIAWACDNGYRPHAALPFPFQRRNKQLCRLISYFDIHISRLLKLKKKLIR